MTERDPGQDIKDAKTVAVEGTKALASGGSDLGADVKLAAVAAKRGGKPMVFCCGYLAAFAVFVMTFSICTFTGSCDAVADTTQVGGTGGGDLANADALTVEQITKLLEDEGSRGKNMLPYAQQIHDAAHKFNINPLFVIAMYIHESNLGTAGAGETCRNPGNISKRSDNYSKAGVISEGNCATVWGGSSRWQGFKTYGDGAQGQMWLLRANYLDKGLITLDQIIGKYAPSLDGNNVPAYVAFINKYMTEHGGG